MHQHSAVPPPKKNTFVDISWYWYPTVAVRTVLSLNKTANNYHQGHTGLINTAFGQIFPTAVSYEDKNPGTIKYHTHLNCSEKTVSMVEPLQRSHYWNEEKQRIAWTKTRGNLHFSLMNSNLRFFLAPTALSLWDTCLLPTLKHADEGVMVWGLMIYSKSEEHLSGNSTAAFCSNISIGLHLVGPSSVFQQDQKRRPSHPKAIWPKEESNGVAVIDDRSSTITRSKLMTVRVLGGSPWKPNPTQDSYDYGPRRKKTYTYSLFYLDSL